MSVMFYLSMQKVGQELCCNYVKVRENLEDLRLSLHGKLSKVCQINTHWKIVFASRSDPTNELV
jgi:hypothetical protein